MSDIFVIDSYELEDNHSLYKVEPDLITVCTLLLYAIVEMDNESEYLIE